MRFIRKHIIAIINFRDYMGGIEGRISINRRKGRSSMRISQHPPCDGISPVSAWLLLSQSPLVARAPQIGVQLTQPRSMENVSDRMKKGRDGDERKRGREEDSRRKGRTIEMETAYLYETYPHNYEHLSSNWISGLLSRLTMNPDNHLIYNRYPIDRTVR